MTYHTHKKQISKLKQKRTRNIILNSISIVLTLGGITWGISFFVRYYRYEITNDATVEQYITPINSRISGYIKEVRFTEHSMVNAGDTLMLIDDREFNIKLMDAEAALMEARNSALVLESSIATARSNENVLDDNIEEANAKLIQVKNELERNEHLLSIDAVSKQQYEQLQSDFEAQKAHNNALIQQKKSLRSITNETEKRQGNAQAVILRRTADLEMARLNLSYTTITAPHSGYVGRRTQETGQLIQAGQTITNLIKDDKKWIIANYREMQIENIYIGQEVNVKVDAIKGKIFKGKVTAISGATGSKYSMLPTDNSAGNFVKIQQRIPVRINFEDISAEDMQKLRAGMMAVIEAIKKR